MSPPSGSMSMPYCNPLLHPLRLGHMLPHDTHGSGTPVALWHHPAVICCCLRTMLHLAANAMLDRTLLLQLPCCHCPSNSDVNHAARCCNNGGSAASHCCWRCHALNPLQSPCCSPGPMLRSGCCNCHAAIPMLRLPLLCCNPGCCCHCCAAIWLLPLLCCNPAAIAMLRFRKLGNSFCHGSPQGSHFPPL